ncbi:50S ribosomal protein L19 [candidate division WWE3 bacterium]|jgi:large subunit ribosomal protein L19|nr:50S ribosomal protein L19 [candidate division WWE3 bacterium]MBT7349388.1 50S ribosomal protein L19 [candidate division WWE3 bacterium]
MADQVKETQENTEEPSVITEDSLPEITDFRVGDTVRVIYKIIEDGKFRRTQPYEGIVISKKGSKASKSFTVRRIGADNIGVERIFPLYSPNIESISVVKKGRVRRAKLYYLRDKTGRAAMRIKERKDK